MKTTLTPTSSNDVVAGKATDSAIGSSRFNALRQDAPKAPGARPTSLSPVGDSAMARVQNARALARQFSADSDARGSSRHPIQTINVDLLRAITRQGV